MHDTNLLEDQPIAWTPTPDVIERAQLTLFMKQVGVSTWDELYEFSIRDVEKFTEEVLKFLDIKFDPPYSRLMDTSEGVEFPRWLRRHESEPDVSGSYSAGPLGSDSPPSEGGVAAASADGVVLSSADSIATVSSHEENHPADEASAPLLRKEGSLHGSVPGAVATGAVDKAERGMRNAESAGLNITTMCLDRWQTDEMKDQPAVIYEAEDQSSWYKTFDELLLDVGAIASGLRYNGLKKGDAIAIHMPMTIETVVALLAINRIGAIAVPVFSGYGVEAIASRMNAVEAKALFTYESFDRRGKSVNAFAIAAAAIERSPSIEKVICVTSPWSEITFPDDRFLKWSELLSYEFLSVPDGQWQNLHFAEPTSAEDPLIILYTSGTTGKPKGIAHTHASFPIKAAQDMAFGTDVGRGTRISWYTDIGWMMGPWLIYGALINGATICIYDGAPDYPTPDRMWEFCAKHKVEVLGISPTLVRALAAHESSELTTPASLPLGHPSLDKEGSREKNSPPVLGGVAAASADGVVLPPISPPVLGGVAAASADGVVLSSDEQQENHPPAKAVPLLRKEGSPHQPSHKRHDLSSLRMFASTGEPWNPAPWWWLFEKVGDSKLPIINYSGGTEIAGGILMGNPLLPIKPCSFPAPCPGMDIDILDEEGKPVKAGQVGELVIKQPWIGMARGFWQEKERYLETYWRRFKNIWVHGDWAMRDKDGHWFILGRSDDTLKVAGKRVGPAEVESLLVAHPLVTEAAVIGVPDEAKGTAMVAFCVLSEPGAVATWDLNDQHHPVRRSGGHPSLDKEGSSDEAETRPVGRVPDDELVSELKALVARDMGKPLSPSKIHFVSALPKTRNAKVMRRVIRAAYLGEDAGDLSSLENPSAVEEIRSLSR